MGVLASVFMVGSAVTIFMAQCVEAVNDTNSNSAR